MVATVVPNDQYAFLSEIAERLIARAMTAAEGTVQTDAYDGPEAVEAALRVQGVLLAVQAVLGVTPLAELGVIAALGGVTGTILAQCKSDRSILWAAFQAQLAATLREVRQALEEAEDGEGAS